MDKELDVIRNQMEQTRSSLADKLEALENQVRGTVEDATSAVTNTVETVQETVENVKEGVQEAVGSVVDTVKDTFNVRKHVENHPWLALGCSVATGFVAGRWILGSHAEPSVQTQPIPQPQLEPFVQTFPPREEQRAAPSYSNGHSAHPNGHAAVQQEEEAAEEQGPSPLQEGLQLIKGLALGSVMSMVRDLVHRVAPQSAAGELDQFVNHLTDRIGGKRLWENEGSGEGDSTHGQRESSEMGRTVGAARW